MERLRYILVLLFAAWSSVQAANYDSVYVQRYSLWRQTSDFALRNPALMTHAYMKTHTQLCLQFDYRHQSDAFRVEEGNGYLLPELQAKTYIRLTPKSVVWGEASYRNGKQFSKSYNSVADFDLLYPDVTADSIGGDTHRERYYFAGGYAVETGRWLLGGELKLRAEQEYRTYDPRMRGIVYDISLNAGAALAIGKYHLGFSAEGNIYRQTADVDLYSEMSSMGELQMTGLGTNYVRFSGSNRSIFYKGKGGRLALDVQPSAKTGWIVHLSHSINEYERILDEYNSLPITTLYRQQTNLKVGWKKQTSKNEKALLVHALYDKRASDEHVAGSAAGQDYPILANLTMYHQHRFDVGATGVYGRGDWHMMLKAGYFSNSEKYEYVQRKMGYSNLYGEFTAQWIKAVKENVKLDLNLLAGYTGNVGSEIVMPYANMSPSIKKYINTTYIYQKASYAHAQASLRADYRPKKWRVGLYGQVATAWKYCTEGEYEANVQGALGVVF